MSFLTPFYALAGLAIIAPIVFHLVRKRPKDKIDFSSSLFLEKDVPRLTKSSQIDQWWLLLVRSLLVLLVAAAFARPYWSSAISVDSTRSGVKRLIMIDVSASMKRGGYIEAAKSKALEWLDSSNPEDLVSVYSFHRDLIPVFSIESSLEAGPEQRRSLAMQAVTELEATWLDTNFGSTVRSAVELLAAEDQASNTAEETAPSKLELVIVSDFQQGGQYEELAAVEWPKGLLVRQVSLGLMDDYSNAFARVIKPTIPGGEVDSNAPSESTADEVSPSETTMIRVSNLPQSQVETLRVGWVDDQGKVIDSSVKEILIPPGQSRNVSIKAMPQNVSSLRLLGDRVEFDNDFYCSSGTKISKTIFCITDRSELKEASAEFFLQQLPLGSDGYRLELRVAEMNENWTLDSNLNPCVFLIGLPAQSALEKISRYLKDGGSVFWLLDRSVSDSKDAWKSALSELTDRDLVDLSEGQVSDFTLLQNIDFSDVLFQQFSDAKYSDFTKVRFWRHRDLGLRPGSSARVLAEFENGKPAILRHMIEKGQLTVMASGWQPEESQLALSSKFLPLMLLYVDASLPTQNQTENKLVGSEIKITGPSTVSMPDGSKLEIAAGEQRSFVAMIPGNYTITSGEGTNQVLSVNIDPKESQIAATDAARLLQLGVPLEERKIVNPTEAMLRQMRAVELESQQGTWRWLLGIVLVAAAFESVFAWLRSYRQSALS